MVKTDKLVKRYDLPSGPLTILAGVQLDLGKGDSLVVMGPSGAGKSTLLYILGGLDTPTSGIVLVDGVNPHVLPAREAARFRNARIGFVFQDHCLLPQCTVLENVLVPALPGGVTEELARRASTLLERVGLSARADHRPAELSGGEKQRVAIARALLLRPALLLCDEPTGNLDRRAASTVVDLLLELHTEQKSCLVLVTHSHEVAAHFPRRAELIDGKLVEQAVAQQHS